MRSVLTLTGVSNQGMGGAGFDRGLRGVTVASAAGVRGAKGVGALVCYVDLENEECEITCPDLLFGRSIIGGRGVMRSVLTLTVASNQSMGGAGFDNDLRGGTVASAAGVRGAKRVGVLVCYVDLEGREVEFGKIYGVYFSPEFLRQRLPEPALGGGVVAAPEAWTRRRRRSSTTRTLRRSSTPPSSTGTAASSGCAPGTAASSLSVQDHATITGFLPGVSASTVHAVGAEVSCFDLTYGGPRGPPTGVMGHSCSSAAGRRIGILLRPARSSQSSRVLGPAASPPILPRGPGQPHFAALAGWAARRGPLWPATTSSPSS